MAADDQFPYDAVPAFRHSLDTLGGAGFLDDEKNPPNKNGEELYAAVPNQQNMTLAGLCGVSPIAIIYLEPSGGDMVIQAVRAMGSNITIASFTVIDHLTGYFGIEWDAGVLPPLAVPPLAVAHLGGRAVAATITSATSIDVTTQTLAGVDADCPVSVHIY